MGRTSPTTLLTFPSELIEAILICSCSPRTVAAVAQTCRMLHMLVYASPDSHLWRELFLTTWDDPRPALEHRALIDPRIDPTAWDWGTEYRRRVSADKWLKAWRRDIYLADDIDFKAETERAIKGLEKNGARIGNHTSDSDWCTTTLSALSAVLDTLLTLCPFPASPPIALTVLTPVIGPYPTGNAGSGVGDQRERMSSAPPLPPLLIVLASGFEGIEVSQSGVRVGRMVYGPYASEVHARALVADTKESEGVKVDSWTPTSTHGTSTLIPTPSLPPQLVRTLLASHAVGVRGLPAYVPNLSGVDCWGDDALGDVFHRIICITGFVPIPPPLPSDYIFPSTSASTSGLISERAQSAPVDVNDGQDDENSEVETPRGGKQLGKKHRPGETDEQTMSRIFETFPTPSQQHADARTLARRRVYDMRYLRGDRLWGPFQPVTRASLNARSGTRTLDANNTASFQKREAHASASGAASARRELRGLDTLAWAMGADIELDNADSTSDDDSGDEDWHDPAETGPGASSSSLSQSGNPEHEQATGTGGEDAAITEDADSDVQIDHEESLISRILFPVELVTNRTSGESRSSRRRTRRSNPRLPPNCSVSPRDIKPEHLRPDYTYLASVRIVVEANLRELFGNEISDDVKRTASDSGVGGLNMFWEDEDAILQAQARSSEQGLDIDTSSRRPSSSHTTPPGGTSTDTNTTTFELADILSLFQNLEVARLGSACGYWSAWIERQRSEMTGIDEDAGTSAPSPKGDIGGRKPRIVTQRAQLEHPIEGASTPGDKGKGKAKRVDSAIESALGGTLGDWEVGPAGEACEGWDWAGVAGIWRRCVCWMDYRELLFFNLDATKFITLGTQEACRIIPMEIQITGYTRAGLMPIYEPEHDGINTSPSPARSKTSVRYFRPPPVIHFSGSSVGSDRGLEDGRSVKGLVQLIGGGEVRWQLDTYTQELTSSGSSTPEWSSEAVQVGGIGSAVGVLGMWTGAEHERADPLGPFWAWKVA